MTITGLVFYPLVAAGPINFNGGPLDISLSTTSAAVDHLSYNPAANIGADDKHLYSGGYFAPTSSPTFTILFGDAFNYNPADGNLLINMTFPYVGEGQGFFWAYNGDANGVFS